MLTGKRTSTEPEGPQCYSLTVPTLSPPPRAVGWCKGVRWRRGVARGLGPPSRAAYTRTPRRGGRGLVRSCGPPPPHAHRVVWPPSSLPAPRDLAPRPSPATQRLRELLRVRAGHELLQLEAQLSPANGDGVRGRGGALGLPHCSAAAGVGCGCVVCVVVAGTGALPGRACARGAHALHPPLAPPSRPPAPAPRELFTSGERFTTTHFGVERRRGGW